MRLRIAKKILKRCYFGDKGPNYEIIRRYTMFRFGKALKRTYKFRVESCRKFNEEHKDSGIILVPWIILDTVMLKGGYDKPVGIENPIGQKIVNSRYALTDVSYVNPLKFVVENQK